MDRYQSCRLSFHLSALLAPILAASACQGSGPKDKDLPPPAGVARFPEVDLEVGGSRDSGPNPWLSGFGGALSVTSQEVETPSDPADPDESRDQPGESTGETPSDPSDSTPGAEDESESDPEVSSGPQMDPAVTPLLGRRFLRYLEGEGSDKLLGLWGESGTSPESCRIEIFSNGGTSPWRTVALPEEFPDGGILVMCSVPEAHPECDVSLSGSLYNGNDALLLSCGTVVMDSFGKIGEDPGDAWTSQEGVLRSEGQDLVRCGEKVRIDPFAPFDLGAEWVQIENGESLETARSKCTLLEALGAGGAGGSTLEAIGLGQSSD